MDNMAVKFKDYRLGDVCQRLSSGKSITSKDIHEKGEFPVFGGNGLRGYSNISNFEGDCALIGRQGAQCGNVHYFVGKGYITEHAIVAVASKDNNTRYLSYVLSSMNLGRLSGQSAQPGLSVGTLAKQIISLPPKAYQERVVSIISPLEDKILINREINDNLEEQIELYYQYLFVTNAKTEWKKGTISDLGDVIGGGTPSKARPEYYTENGIGWITPKDLATTKAKFISHGENDISELGLKNSSATIMPKGTILFSSRAPIGYIAIASGEVTTNQGFKSVVPHPEIGTAYVYSFIKHNIPVIEGLGSGTTFKEVSGGTMRNVPAIIPDEETLSKFTDFCTPLLNQQYVISKEIQKLTSLRDYLLPLLMSGQISI